ncbi:hypothetical protein J2Z23_000504 [Lederbergia galactosidilyticus]|uniref:hypothetical protein n=1 Tax=Lederbergia galactosidilytica TaxID=217031 RepID=UPI001AE56BC0|nr:hypothetical protein [Lederbergia galactosidilytica]MBP1913567.1 hypothetical protein [Lederbergia galactosidilytica]
MEKNKQTEANKKWQEKNKKKAKYLSDRSRARSFIRNQAELEDIEEFIQLLKERENVLKSENRNEET